ncbi:peptidase inhibitor family I36 protein [Streptomyces sp. BBFR25]|uniref:peptidase inhibitor family I36 protein n=1 Tax=Streptomyces sp. BBFR25 TaxID=3372855 RepID=UPI0037DCE2D8
MSGREATVVPAFHPPTPRGHHATRPFATCRSTRCGRLPRIGVLLLAATANAAPHAWACNNGSFCVYRADNGTGSVCGWSGDGPDWRNGTSVCGWAGGTRVQSAYNNGLSGTPCPVTPPQTPPEIHGDVRGRGGGRRDRASGPCDRPGRCRADRRRRRGHGRRCPCRTGPPGGPGDLGVVFGSDTLALAGGPYVNRENRIDTCRCTRRPRERPTEQMFDEASILTYD